MKNFKFNWGHGVVLAMASFVIFILYLIFIFPMGQQNSELVSDNYYEDELAYQNIIDAKQNAQMLSELPQYSQNKAGIKITFPKDINNTNSKFVFYLFRTDNKNLDVKKEFTLDQNQSFTIPSKILVPGNYTLKIKWIKENKNYQVDYDVIWN